MVLLPSLVYLYRIKGKSGTCNRENQSTIDFKRDRPLWGYTRPIPDITDELFDELVNKMKIRDRFDGTLSVVLHSLAKTKFY